MADIHDPLSTYAPPRQPVDPKADALAQAERAHRAGHIDWQAIVVIRKALRPAPASERGNR